MVQNCAKHNLLDLRHPALRCVGVRVCGARAHACECACLRPNSNFVADPSTYTTRFATPHSYVRDSNLAVVEAQYASHGYLTDLPKVVQVLGVEVAPNSTIVKSQLLRPTFAEYGLGQSSGRDLAACQCFHDRDGSKRGALMTSTLEYCLEQAW